MSLDSSTPITSSSNRRIVEARKLSERKYRAQQGRFLVEGLQVLHMALDGGARPLEVFYCEELFVGTQAAALLRRFRRTPAELVPVSRQVMGTLAQREYSQGIVAAFALFETPLVDLTLDGPGLVVVLEHPQDPGNTGTLIRAADAVGARAVILVEPCADPFDPKTVRSSMGSLFNLPLARTPDVAGLFERLHGAGLRTVGADSQEGTLWGRGLWEGGVALVLGNEARGLSAAVRARVQYRARLPMAGKADSLNVAVAGGVLMYLWMQANFREPGE